MTAYGYTVPAFCTVPGELPLGSFPIPPIGGFYIDANFGAKVRLLTDGTTNSFHQYSTPSAFSATGKYLFLAKIDGSTRIVETATANIVVPNLTGITDPSSALWSATNDDILYGIGCWPCAPSQSPTQIYKYQVSTQKKTVLIDYATDGHHFSQISFGGTGDLSVDNWASFWAEKEHQVCAVDLNVLKTYCADYTAPNPNNRVGWKFIDYVMITKGKDVDSNKRYVLLMAEPAIGVYSVNEQTGVLDFEFRGPEKPLGVMGGDTPGVGNKDGICDPGEDCFNNYHADVFQDNGRQYILMGLGVDQPVCEGDLVSLQISKGIQMLAPVESGGGRKFIFTLFKCGGVTWSDAHYGCAKSANAFCVVSTDLQATNLPNQIRDGRTPFEDEVIVIRGNGLEARRLAMHRSVTTTYSDTPRACISNDGGMVLWDSNFGNPANHRVVLAETGFVSPSQGSTCSYALNPISLTVPAAGGSGTIAITPSANTCGNPTASSNSAWATASASGNVVNWSVTANGNIQSRIGSLSVSGQTVPITQAGTVAIVSMTLFPNSLVLGTSGTLTTAPQTVSLSFAGGASPSWTAISSRSNITVFPTSGVGNATLSISVTPGASGIVTINAVGAVNSPQIIPVQINTTTVTAPFGSFDTPANNSKASAAIAVTGWALDSVGITKVDIWREPVGPEPPGLQYIGDAVFVPGARPDIATSFPTYPSANNAGWGYLLLTNFLPNANGARGSGNGMYTLHALAHNVAGVTVDLGSRSITVDNTDATLPFGNIDTPGQGATVWGKAYVNFGWALTPMPGTIPVDGTTITVNIDGVTIGHPNYNQFRGDIATLFPGFANSNGAIGFAYVDTTKLTNGLHTISWNVWDNKIRGNGVGSRFFNVLNVGDTGAPAPIEAAPATFNETLASSDEGASRTRQQTFRDEVLSMSVEEMDRIEVPVGGTSGYLVANGERQPLPIGSTLQGGVFYWQLAPVFLGEYHIVFERPSAKPTHLRIIVRPKSYSNGEMQAVQ